MAMNIPFRLLAIVVSLCAAPITLGAITDTPLEADDQQNATMAYHLATSGVISASGQSENAPIPSMRREPFPAMVHALFYIAHPFLSDRNTLEEVTEGRLVKHIKQVNVIWAFFLFLGVFSLSSAIFRNPAGSFAIASFTIIVSMAAFVYDRADRLFTELPAAALMVWASVALLRLVRERTLISAVLTGIVFGLLVLTKASFLYIGLVALVVMAAILWKQERTLRGGQGASPRPAFVWARLPAIAALVLLAICSAWATRNVIQFDKFAIAERGGDVLYYRLLKMEQSTSGAIYAWSPASYRPLVGAITGYEPADLRSGQELAAFRRANDDSIHRQRRAIFQERMEAAGLPYRQMTRLEQEHWLGQEALKAYAADPVRYAMWVPVFAWRGSFTGADSLGFLRILWNPLPENVTLLLYLNFLAAGIGGVLLLRPTLGPAFLLPIGTYMFHAMFSHNIPRYNEPLIPFLWLAAFISGAWLARAAYGFHLRRKQTDAVEPNANVRRPGAFLRLWRISPESDRSDSGSFKTRRVIGE